MTGNNTTVVRLTDVSLRFGKTLALDRITVELPPGIMIGLVGPDGVGKSTLLSLVTGARAMQSGEIEVLGGDMRDKHHRDRVCPRIAYMPQGLGKNLYLTLTVEENLQYFARLFGHDAAERRRRIDHLTHVTGLYPFLDRPAGKLSGGMKQKLALCCALIHDPELLVLDEPTTGVDPLARRQFWRLIDRVRAKRPGMGVVVATAYMDEAQRFDRLIAMDAGKILAIGSPAELMAKTGCDTLDAAFIRLLPEEKNASHRDLVVPPLPPGAAEDYAIEAENLTRRFGNFTAVDHVSFRIRRGEIFGFLGSNGCGKTTTMRMLTGLLPASEGRARLFGRPIGEDSMEVRQNLGYMTQSFSLYSELTVRQNLVLSARLCRIPEQTIPGRVAEMMARFHLNAVADARPDALPLGIRQRLSLAAAVVHRPKLLILDEPTSGVDPVARDEFWELIIALSRQDRVTIFITTHFMNEAARCDRISLMHAGKSLACDTPAALIRDRGTQTLEEAFIDYLRTADPSGDTMPDDAAKPDTAPPPPPPLTGWRKWLSDRFSVRRWYSCCWRENLELIRDPIRLTLALFGALVLMCVIGYGVNMDVESLSFAVLDRDGSELSRNYTLDIAGSRYFNERRPVLDYRDMDRRMRSGELSMVLEFPPGFGKLLEQGQTPAVGVWIDGAMPMRAQTIQGYVRGIHTAWLSELVRSRTGVSIDALTSIEIRYRYNPDVRSLPAMIPAVIPILLLMIPAVLAALSVVREKELGSIINLYVTPLTKAEFLLGKQLPYVGFSFVSGVLLVLEARMFFGIPVKGSLPTLLAALLLYCVISTGMGLLASSLTRSQIAVMFLTMVGTMLPAIQFCGLINPVATLSGAGHFIGSIYPTTRMLVITRGIFNKALDFPDLRFQFYALLLTAAVVLALGVVLQKKQSR